MSANSRPKPKEVPWWPLGPHLLQPCCVSSPHPTRPRTSVPPRAPGLRVPAVSTSGSVPRQPDLRGALPGAMGHTLVLLFPITRFLSCRFLSSFHLASWVSQSFEVERWCVQAMRCRLRPFSAVHLGKSSVSRSLCNHSYYKFLVIWEITL